MLDRTILQQASDPGLVGWGEIAGSSEPLQPSSSSSTAADSTSIRRGLKSLLLSGQKNPTIKTQDTWGPLGLNLIYSPPDPLIDFIFVHGLRGGSIKTWCKSEDLRLFWPQAWLPRDSDLQNARIHSFGYNSDWGESQDATLDLCDFGRLLLGELVTSPVLRKGKQTPILLIGHSMGGLVMKKAYLLAQQDKRAQELTGRIRGMFFFATPHHGSDYAKLLNSLLRASTVLHPKQYVADLARNSAAISAINNEFRLFADDLHIWSFYETLKTKTGASSVMVVERDSAILGNKHEVVNPINANHRNICKFDSPSHPNYIFIRNSLVKAAEDVLAHAFGQRADEMKLRIGALETFLHIVHNAEDDLNATESKKTRGSCLWITNLQSFRDWRDADEELVLFHWLTGQAGAGKSVLTSHIIRHLQGLGFDTCFYFFRHGQKTQQTTSCFLRSLAFQMALIHPSARDILFSMEVAGVRFDMDDERALWRKLFVNGILQSPISTTQFWVIDGLDECIDSEKLFCLLKKFDSTFTTRILFSSRRLPDLEKHVACFQPRVYRHHIAPEETKDDIKRFIENNSDELPVEPEDRPALMERLVQKSDGGFLWAELAFEGLRRVFSEAEIDVVLEEVPAGMVPLYDRILESMAQNRRQAKLAKAILEWTVCGTRVLRTAELEAILNYDLNTKIRNIERTVDELCGQLLDINNDQVRLIHATAGDFLLSENSNPIFGLDRAATNEHLAAVCLKYLTGSEMRPPRHPALVSKPVLRSPFLDYACTSFSEHLAASSSASNQLLRLVDQFLRGNVLSWVEYIFSEKRSVHHLIRTSKNLRTYLNRWIKHPSPDRAQLENIEGWQADLLRVALKFGDDLLRDPSAIHFIVPALCPTTSRIYRQFGDKPKGLRLSGLANHSWDDCVRYIEHRQSRALSLAGGDGVFAIGMKSGAVTVYHQLTCCEITSLDHGEPARFLKFSNASRLLASGGYRQIKMWSIHGELLWMMVHEGMLSTMSFSEGDENLMVAYRNGSIVALSAENGTKEGDRVPNLRGFSQIALTADICPKAELLAVTCRGWPPQIWSIQDNILITSCHLVRDEPGAPIIPSTKVLFNPNPAIELLAVGYQDGELAIFNTWARGDREVKSLAADSFSLASTSDGRTLASGDAHGTIKLWDFETLTLLYCIKSTEHEIRSLAFSADGFRLYDIKDTRTRIWEPAMLMRKAIDEEPGVGKSVAAVVPVVGRDRPVVDIVRIHAPPDAGCVFTGMDDGSVVAYNWDTGDMISTLYSHNRGRLVTDLSWNHSMIATATFSRHIEAHALTRTAPNYPWVSAGKRFEAEVSEKIRELSLHPKEPWLLVFQAKQSTVIDIPTGGRHPLPRKAEDDYRAWLWLTLRTPSNILLGARAHCIDIYQFDTLGSEWQTWVWCLSRGGKPVEQTIDRLLIDKQEKYIAVLLDVAHQTSRLPRLLVYQTTPLGRNEDKALTFEPVLALSARKMRTFLGFYRGKAIYLDHQLWVQAVDLTTGASQPGLDVAQSERYLFIPQEVIGSGNDVDGLVTGGGSVVFPKDGELAVIRNVFDWPFRGESVEGHGSRGADNSQSLP